MLHTQVGQIPVYTFQRVLFEHAGQVLPAGVGVLCQLGHGQMRVGVVGLKVSNRLGDEQTGGRGRRGIVPPGHNLADQQNQLRDFAALHGIAYFFIKIHGLGHPLQQTAKVPLRDGVSVQNDPATYDEGVDFMFGDSLLVANVVEKGQTVRPVYLPVTENENERFYDFYTREEYAPGQTIEVPVDIASIPLFVRSGAILPMSGNKLHNLMTEKTTALDILMAPDVDSEFTLYEDDGRTNDYRKGAYLKTKIAVKAGVKTVVTFTNEGSYETAVESMYLDMIHREKSPFYVQVDGKELPHFLHRRKFEEAESGWYYSQRLKSVQIKYPNPKKDHEVLVSFEQFDLIGM